MSGDLLIPGSAADELKKKKIETSARARVRDLLAELGTSLKDYDKLRNDVSFFLSLPKYQQRQIRAIAKVLVEHVLVKTCALCGDDLSSKGGFNSALELEEGIYACLCCQDKIIEMRKVIS